MSAETSHNRYRIAAWAVVVATIVLLRLPAFWTPILDVDESQFAGITNAMLDGGAPYTSGVDTKPLGIYYFFAVIFLLFGKNNLIAVHMVTALWVGLTAFFCYRIARSLYSARAGFLAALFYAVFTTTYIPKFISTSITIVMMLPLTASIYALIVWAQSKRLIHVAIAGVLWGVACLFKYQAGIDLFVVGIYFLLIWPLLGQAWPWRPRVAEYITFISGGAFVGALFMMYIIATGSWDAFVFWSLKGSFAYASATHRIIDFWGKLAVFSGSVVLWSLPLWLLGVWQSAWLTRCLIQKKTHGARAEEYLILCWLILSIVPVTVGGRFYGHYFLQLYPALCILAAGAANVVFENIQQQNRADLKRKAIALLVIGLAIPAITAFMARLYYKQVNQLIGEEDPEIYIPAAEYVRERTSEGDTIFVWGFATPIYFYSGRDAASRFLWCDWMTGRVSGVKKDRQVDADASPYATEGSWELLMKDFKKNKPIYFIDTSPGNYHNYSKYPVTKYPRLADFLKYNYRFEANVLNTYIYRRNDS